MSNSPLVQYTKISPNSSNPRNNKIKKITIHHMAGVLSVETCGNIFANPKRQASSNYAIGSDGRIAMYVEEKNRSWCSSSANNDNQAITIEVSNSQKGGNWPVSDYVLSRLIDLCVDICKRNGIDLGIDLPWVRSGRIFDDETVYIHILIHILIYIPIYIFNSYSNFRKRRIKKWQKAISFTLKTSRIAPHFPNKRQAI